MQFLSTAKRVWVYGKPVNMGCSFPRLTELVETQLKKKVQAGDMFLFVNKKQNYVKILWGVPNGVCIFAKRLWDNRRYAIPNKEQLTLETMQEIVNEVTLKKAPRVGRLERAVSR